MFTKRQQNDLKTIEYFIPDCFKGVEITDADKNAFLLISERGIRPEVRTKGIEALEEGKRWRGIHMQMYEDGVQEGSVPYSVLLKGLPRSVVDFMKKEMFKGVDAETIENVYAKSI